MTDEKRLPTNLTLTVSEKIILKEIGDGNMSQGVKKLIEDYTSLHKYRLDAESLNENN